jgi:prophage regulatory protein
MYCGSCLYRFGSIRSTACSMCFARAALTSGCKFKTGIGQPVWQSQLKYCIQLRLVPWEHRRCRKRISRLNVVVRWTSPLYAEASFAYRPLVAILGFQDCSEGAALSHAKHTAAVPPKPESEPAFYRIADVIRITALSRSSIYRRIAAGEFPPQVSLGGRATGWRREALQTWIGDPAGFRPLGMCEVQRSSAGARVRHVKASPVSSRSRVGE